VVEGAEPGSRVEEVLASIDVDDGRHGVHLPPIEDVLVEDSLVARGQGHWIGRVTSGAGKGDEEQGDLPGISAFVAPYSIGVVSRLESLLLVLALPALAGEIGVLDRLDGKIQPAELGLVVVAGLNDVLDRLPE
jgi:hypothetical protein